MGFVKNGSIFLTLKMIKSKFGNWLVFFSLIALALIAVGVYFGFHKEMTFKGKLGITTNGIRFGAIWMVMGLVILYFVVREISILTISQDFIGIRRLFKKRIIEKNEIQRLNLLGRTTVLLFDSGAIIIHLKSGEQVDLGDFAFRNYPAIKQTLQQYYPTLVEQTRPKRTRGLDKQDSAIEKFSGNHFISVNGLLFYGLSISFLIMPFLFGPSTNPYIILFPVLMAALIYFAFGRQFFYFILDGHELIIKNHLHFWVEKRFHLNDIQQVVIERQRNQSITLLIITSDFTVRKYGAGSLRDKTWKSLVKKLRGSGIAVINEAV